MLGLGGCTVHSLTDPPNTVVTADKITWNSRVSEVVATGNAHVTRRPLQGAPTDPPDIVLDADRIAWDIKQNKIVATGNTHLIRRPRDGSLFIEQNGGRISFDTELQQIEVR